MGSTRLLAAVWVALGAPVAVGQGSSAFDPSTYINQKAAETAPVADDKLTTKAIYRIDGQRFQKFSSTVGAVLLPSTGSKPELLSEFALCEQHLKLLTEVIPVRQDLPIEPEIKKDEAKILDMIQMCREGRIKGPVLTLENPDGSLTTVEAAKPKPKSKKPPRAADDQ